MSRHRTLRRFVRRAPGHTGHLALILSAVVAIALLPVLLAATPDDGRPQATGEVNAMGLPVVATPGESTGTSRAGDIEVSGAHWALGTVPLDVSVQPEWTLRNTGRKSVTLGEPHAEVRQGCCPGALTLGTAALNPGAETTLTFDLAMHAGMDGWHDMAVHVPVEGRADTLTLTVTGDFRG